MPSGSEAARRRGGGRSQLRFLRIVCPENHPLIEVVPGLDGPVLLPKGAASDKARPATRLAALGRDTAVWCRCDCAVHDVPVSWITARLGAGVIRVVWGGPA